MSVLIHSDDVFKETELIANSDGVFHCSPLKDKIGSLPTLFTNEGIFNHEANSYFFYQRGVLGIFPSKKT